LFRVSTLDLANLPRTADGKVDFAQDFFGREAFLTVSGQLNVEAYCLALTKVYTFRPTFRAENSNTSRHLAEFWMIEPEIAFANLADNAALAEALLKYTFAALLDQREEDLAFFDQRIEKGRVAKLEQQIAVRDGTGRDGEIKQREEIAEPEPVADTRRVNHRSAQGVKIGRLRRKCRRLGFMRRKLAPVCVTCSLPAA
jgi:aspartyl/asparaginyl-tRNA synthetase